MVLDVPEAIWSNLGLTYLAHTHIDTVWTKKKIEMAPSEWERREDGTLWMQRRLPNGIVFGPNAIRRLRTSTTGDAVVVGVFGSAVVMSQPDPGTVRSREYRRSR